MITEPLRPQLGAHAEALIADVLDKREDTIINSVVSKLAGGHVLEPQFAISQWIALAEARKLRNSLIKRSEIESARLAQL